MAKPKTIRRAWAKAIRGLYDAVASTVVSAFGGTYAALDPRRKIMPNAGITMRSYSANELANISLPQLRTLCRKLERDNATARAIVEGLVAQVVGTGIGLEPDTGDKDTDKRIRKVWVEYIKGCDVSGRRSIYDLQTQAFREVVTTGEFIWRMPVLEDRAKAGQVPVCVLPLESEWISTDLASERSDGITHVNGMDLDRYGRPLAYYLANPEMLAMREPERVAAGEIIHGFERRRSLQNRGEPWLAPIIERLWQEGDLVDAELRAAVNCAGMAIVITSKSHGEPDTTVNGTPEDPAMGIAVGSVARIYPDEDVKAFSHNRPSQQIAPFRTTLRGDQAAACRVSQRWLDRDYSKANYSSLRADNLDSDRLISPTKEWFGHSTIGETYLRALPYLCVLAGIPLPKRKAYRLIPDGQPYVDPYKDAQAAALAISAGLTTWEAEIGKRGGDYREVWAQLAIEREEAQKMGLVLDLSGTNAPAPDSTVGTPTQEDTNNAPA